MLDGSGQEFDGLRGKQSQQTGLRPTKKMFKSGVPVFNFFSNIEFLFHNGTKHFKGKII